MFFSLSKMIIIVYSTVGNCYITHWSFNQIEEHSLSFLESFYCADVFKRFSYFAFVNYAQLN